MIFRRLPVRRVLGVSSAVLVAAAVLTGCMREEEAEDIVQEVEQSLTPTPGNDDAFAVATQSPTISQPTVAPAETPIPASATVPAPTPFVTPTATATPTPTPQPGVCPTPKRTTPADFAEPPQLRPASEIPGQRLQGGVSYSEAYVTVHLPAGREFIILSVWSQDDSNLLIRIYDAQTGSSLWLRGDGCERDRFVREPAADAAFDEMMKTLEVGSVYACPVPLREVVSPPTTETRGSVVQGGVPVQLGPMTLHLPAGREFTLGSVLSDPGGTSYRVYDIQTGSGLSLRGDGCEIGRRISDPAADAVFDEIVATLQASSR